MISLTINEYEKYRRKGQKTNEGYVFTYPRNRQKIIKVIEPSERVPEYLGIKQHTIKLLLANAHYLSGLKIAYPEEGVEIDDIKRAYLANNIKGINLSSVLSNPAIPVETKIDYLKQIGKTLRQMDSIRQTYPHLSNFYYNDIHENNFLVTNDNQVYGIDLDSCQIGNNIPIQGMYSLSIPKSKRLSQKYHQCPQVCEYASNIIPDTNFDLYCYIMIILNFLYGIPLYNRWNPTKLNNYLDYLDSHGANLEFLYIILSIYDESVPNINPDYLLDSIKEIYPYSNIHYNESDSLRKILK